MAQDEPPPELATPSEKAPEHGPMPWSWRLGGFFVGLALSMANFLVGYGRIPAEAPPASSWLWIVYVSAGVLTLVCLGLSAWLLDDGLVAGSMYVGGTGCIILNAIGMYVLGSGGGFGPGLAVFGLSWLVLGMALLRSPPKRKRLPGQEDE